MNRKGKEYSKERQARKKKRETEKTEQGKVFLIALRKLNESEKNVSERDLLPLL